MHGGLVIWHTVYWSEKGYKRVFLVWFGNISGKWLDNRKLLAPPNAPFPTVGVGEKL